MNALAGLMNPAAVGQSVTDSFNQGRETARQSHVRNALAAYAANPSAQTAAAVAPYDPMTAIKLGQFESEAAQRKRKLDIEARKVDLPVLGALLDHATDEPSYQQALAAAKQYGIDTGTAPPNYDPNWVGQQKMVLKALQTPKGQEDLSTAGKQARDAGFQPGTPEYTDAVRQIVTAGLAQPYTGSQGETRLYQPQVFGQQQPQAAPQGNAPAILKQATARGYIMPDEAEAVKAQLGPNGQGAFMGWLQQNKVKVATRTGTAADGRKVVQFEDGTVEYAD